jgi:hypothetical protein
MNRKRDLKQIGESYAKIYEQVDAIDRYLDAYFEDLYNVTDANELLAKVRQRVETPEFVQKIGNARAGNLTEMIVQRIKQRQMSATQPTPNTSTGTAQPTASTNTELAKQEADKENTQNILTDIKADNIADKALKQGIYKPKGQ